LALPYIILIEQVFGIADEKIHIKDYFEGKRIAVDKVIQERAVDVCSFL